MRLLFVLHDIAIHVSGNHISTYSSLILEHMTYTSARKISDSHFESGLEDSARCGFTRPGA